MIIENLSHIVECTGNNEVEELKKTIGLEEISFNLKHNEELNWKKIIGHYEKAKNLIEKLGDKKLEKK